MTGDKFRRFRGPGIGHVYLRALHEYCMPGSLGLDHGLDGWRWVVGYAAQLSYDINTMVKMLQWVVTYLRCIIL